VRENARAKSVRYLAEGRLIVEHVDGHTVKATCRGDGAIYQVSWSPDSGWTCNCPAKTRCAHLLALMAVTVRKGTA
jgi:uncharacterized Zn finger protein